jgi:hypothetical protein
MEKFSKLAGLDVHKATIAVAVASADGLEARFFGQINNTPDPLLKASASIES